MARTLYRRDSLFMRAVSTVVSFMFVLSIAGTGVAAPAVTDATATSQVASSESSAVPDAAVPDAATAQDPAGPSVEAQPTTSEPASRPRVARRVDKRALSARRATAKKSVPTASTLALAATPLPYADFTDVGWEAYRVSPQSQVGWAKSNLGQYYENDWVPVRLFVDNTGGTGDLLLPSFAIDFDHYDSTKNAIGVDKARNYMYYTGASLPTGPNPPAGSTALGGVSDADGGSSPAYHITYSPAGDVIVPQGQYGVVYFEAHLALTPYWQQLTNKSGARDYPGSSAQGRFISWDGKGTGQKTISLPVGRSTIPTGRINGVKFNDLDRDGVRDQDEPGLAGWEFTLAAGGQFPFTMTATSGDDGTFSFSELPSGSYTLTETQQDPWENSTPNPLTLSLGSEQTSSVAFGNYLPDKTKTWELSIDALPAGAEPFVTYKLEGVATTTTLAGPPYAASIDALVGSEITDIHWLVHWLGSDIELGTMKNETLDDDMTNTFTYDSSVSGMKFHDLDGDGVKGEDEPGLPGWTIVLKRVDGETESTYAQTVTDEDGLYSFEDVLPGTYAVYEVNQNGWYNTVAPTGTFTVADDSAIAEKDFGNLELLSALVLEKSGDELAHVGDTVNYSIVVTNAGNYLLTNILVTDPLLALSQTIPSLAPGESATINAERVVGEADPDPLPNTASALGIDVLGNPVSASDDHAVDVIHPAIGIVKSVSPQMAVNPADVEYTYVVTNSGDDTLTAVNLVDDKLDVPGALIGTLVPGQTVTLTADATLAESTTNLATAVGTDSLGDEVSADDTADVSVFNPSISIVKSADPIVIVPGESVGYTYLVTNTGDIALTNLAVVDDVLGPVGVLSLLGPGDTHMFMMTTSPEDDVVNVGTVTGDYGTEGTEFFGTVTDSSSASVDVVDPDVEIVKSATPSPVIAGTTVTYSYVVRNTGDVALIDLTVVDDVIGAIGSVPALAVGEEAELTATAVLDETTTNIATVSGEDVYHHVVTDTDDETVDVYNPSIEIDKTVSDGTVLSGDTVTYFYLVTNAGDIELHDIAVVDDVLGTIGTIASLAPGASQTLTMDSAIADDVTNTGTATGAYGDSETPFFGSVSDSDEESVNVIAPDIEVVKSASPSQAVAGETITYSYLVKNTGDVTLFDIVVTDDKLGEIATIAELGAGEETTVSASAELDETTTNVVTVSGHDDEGNPVDDTDETTVPVFNPSISIVKSADPIVITPGELVGYTYLVTNTGDIALTDLLVVDDVIGPIGTLAQLGIGESYVFMATANPAVDVVNVGTVTANYGTPETDFFGEVSGSSSASVDVVNPAIEVSKSASPSTVVAGTSVTYTYVVRNAGDVALYDVTVVDDILGGIGTIPVLNAGEEATLTATAVLDETTTNVVTVNAEDANGHAVSDTDSETVEVFNPSIAIVKTASPDVVLAGEIVTYTYLVTNTGDATLTNVVVDDDVLGLVATIPMIAPGQALPVSTSAAIGTDTTNIATATGTYGTAETDFFGTVSATDTAFVDVVGPAMTVEKSGAPNPVVVGSTVTYTYIVHNTGDVALFDIELTDDQLGVVGTLAELPAGESHTFTATQPLNVTTTNVVSATAADEFGHPVDATATFTVDVFSPSIEVVKSASAEVILGGETVTYTYVVTNTGDIDLNNVQLSDDHLGDLGNLGVLAAGESTTVVSSASIDVDTTNIATATGEYGTVDSQFFGTVSDTDEAVVDVIAPAIEVVKTATPTEILSGETVVYTYVVRNIGDVPLNDVVVTDDLLGPIGTVETLAVGAESEFTASAALTVPTTNIATAVASDDFGHEVSDTDDAFVDVAAPFTPPNLTIEKTADRSSVSAGDLVRYTVTYENIGPSPASEMVITDDFDERYVTVVDAAGGTVADGVITWQVAGPLTADDGPQTITYSVRIDEDLPASVEQVRNTVVITEPTEVDTSDNSDTFTVDIESGDEPFLPFTGGEWILLLGAAAAATATGLAFRRTGRSERKAA